jgi:hypothetical protein
MPGSFLAGSVHDRRRRPEIVLGAFAQAGTDPAGVQAIVVRASFGVAG